MASGNGGVESEAMDPSVNVPIPETTGNTMAANSPAVSQVQEIVILVLLSVVVAHLAIFMRILRFAM